MSNPENPILTVFNAVCDAVQHEKEINGEKLFMPEVVDHVWNIAMALSKVPVDQHEAFVESVYQNCRKTPYF